MPHLAQRFLRVLAEAGVEEAIDERVDGVVDKEGLDAELVGHLADRAEATLEILDGASQDHDHQVGQEAEDVGQRHREQHRGCLPYPDLSPLARLLHHFRFRRFFRFLVAAAGYGAG